MKIQLGVEAKDRVSGIKGIVIGRTEWLNGCVRYGLAHVIEGKQEEHWADEQQVEIVGIGVTAPPTVKDDIERAAKRGGPMRDPKF